MKSKTTFIYYLSTKEESDKIRYIGKTDNPKDREKRHLQPYYLNEGTYKSNWLKSELKKGNTPILTVIDEVAYDEWEFWEKFWIEQFISWGFKLTNGTAGGEGFGITQEAISRRNKTNFDRGTDKFKKEIEKYNVRLEDGGWVSERNCPKCNTILTYKKNKRHDALKSVRRGDLNKRTCLNCRDCVKNLGEYYINKS
jgi:RNase P subunit RPR2